MINFDVMGKNWVLSVLPDKEYVKTYGDDSEGITVYSNKSIYIKLSCVSYDTVAHELFHAFVQEHCINGVSVEQTEMEEFYANMFANRGLDMVMLSYKIYSDTLNISLKVLKEVEKTGVNNL